MLVLRSLRLSTMPCVTFLKARHGYMAVTLVWQTTWVSHPRVCSRCFGGAGDPHSPFTGPENEAGTLVLIVCPRQNPWAIEV